MDESQIKHLEMIQSVINRVANNSFVLKGWTITLTAALFALAAKDANRDLIVLALFPALAFWGLDAYYLRLERCFRKLHDDICRSRLAEANCTVSRFSMEIKPYKRKVRSWFATLFSPTVLLVHGIIVLLILVMAFGSDVVHFVSRLIH